MRFRHTVIPASKFFDRFKTCQQFELHHFKFNNPITLVATDKLFGLRQLHPFPFPTKFYIAIPPYFVGWSCGAAAVLNRADVVVSCYNMTTNTMIMIAILPINNTS